MGAIQSAVNSTISNVGNVVGNMMPKKPNKEPFATHSDAKKKIATDNANKNKTARKTQQANFKNKINISSTPISDDMFKEAYKGGKS